ncbi:DNA repair protein RadC [Catenovulum sp. 2E275]|uniref:RadC family protein n=1 Tax=Catenovulum sp. 2E275 TaxID=2980497 RepID=UPI0021CFE652|nr:DNA repair protein RadC [Catenovulum sp. 2E275]MCU4677588.1 DNA repair protein RadC [Catenovulum sp. 2E275]
MSIKDWPATERPREKLLAKGAQALTDAELLAIFLRTGVTGCSAVQLAQQLLSEFGSLRKLLAADLTQFCSAKGLGAAKFTQLQACLEMSKRYLAEVLKKGDALTSVAACREFLKAHLRDQPHEIFACLFLDNQHRVIEFAPLFYGTIDGASVYPRVVVEKCLAKQAAAVIFAHNHPSGIAEPSQADKAITERLKQALALVDIRVLDHFIVGDGEVLSFAEHGLL